MPKKKSTEFLKCCILAGDNLSRRLWEATEMKRTCRDGPKDIQDVVGDKSDIVTLIL